TRFARDDSGQFWATVDASNAVQNREAWGDGVNQIEARIDVAGGGALYWAQADHTGSVRDVFGATGVLTHEEYAGFGAVQSETDATKSGNVLYTGLWYERGVSLYLTPNRAYDPAIGRWLQPDQSVFTAGDPNLYRYVGNKVTLATDPSGLKINGRI